MINFFVFLICPSSFFFTNAKPDMLSFDAMKISVRLRLCGRTQIFRPTTPRPPPKGCSQLPDGPRSRLYSPKIADVLASALSAGLEDRMDSARMTSPYGGCEDRKQVETLRLGNNRFRLSSWTDLFRVLSSQPPRDLDASFASIWHHFPANVDQGDESERPTLSPLLKNANLREGADGTENGDGAARQLLFELLAMTILPADAPGVETLDLTGSTGFLPLFDRTYCEEREKASGGDICVTSLSWSSTTEAFFIAVRDALMSPLCRTVRLSLSGARGPSSSWVAGSASFHVSGRATRALSPEHVKVLCEATSACASLRCLDLSGSDLSGSLGATVAAAAVVCLIRSNHNDYNFDEDTLETARAAVEARDGAIGNGLSRLSLRACRLGIVGLSSVVGALAAAAFVSEDDVRAKAFATASLRPGRFFLPRFPRYLDLSDNRLADAVTVSIALEQEDFPEGLERGETEEATTADTVARPRIVREQERDALQELSASFRLLKQHGLASIAGKSSIARTSPRCDSLENHELFTAGRVHDHDV